MQKLLAVLGLSLSLMTSTTKAGALDQLDFMTGVWRNDAQGQTVEEWWMPIAGKTKVAAFRWAQADKVIAIELVVISEEDDGVFLRFKHYSHDFVPWEKDEPNVYKLIDIEGPKATFERVSQNEKVPLFIIYSLNDDGLHFLGTGDLSGANNDGDLALQFKKQQDAP